MESFPRTLPQSLCHSRNAATGEIMSLTLQRPQARPTSILTQKAAKVQEGCSRPLYPVLAGALYHFSRLRTSLSQSRCSWSGASSSIFHRTACASPSVSYSLRSTVPSSSNSTRAQLNNADHQTVRARLRKAFELTASLCRSSWRARPRWSQGDRGGEPLLTPLP